jgi:protein gp37
MDSMWDWNSKGVKEEWLFRIIKKMEECPQHTFQILSKKPAGYSRFAYPKNVWLGTSICTNDDIYRIHDLKHSDLDNLKFVSIEPIHEKIVHWFTDIDWLIVGAETGNSKGKVIPKREWIAAIIENAKSENIPAFIKDNLRWPEEIREFLEA